MALSFELCMISVLSLTDNVSDEWGCLETFHLDDDQGRIYRDIGISIVKAGLRLYGDGKWSDGWTLAADDRHHGDRAYYARTEKFGKVVAVETTVNADVAAVFQTLWDDIENVSVWNPTVKDHKILIDYSDRTRIVYNSSQEVLGGLISSRDFVDVNTWRKIDAVYYLAGCSVEYSGMLPQKGKIRGDNLIGWMRISETADKSGCTNVCLMANTDFKGMLPRSLVERGVKHFVVEYVRNFKRHMESSKDKLH